MERENEKVKRMRSWIMRMLDKEKEDAGQGEGGGEAGCWTRRRRLTSPVTVTG